MIHLLLDTLSLGLISFVTTNIDDFILLILLFSNRSLNTIQIVAGQFLGMTAILTLVWLSSSLGIFLVPHQILRYFGILPICIGIAKGVDLFLNRKTSELPVLRKRKWSTLGIALLTFANSADNIAVYVPLFVTSSLEENATLTFIYYLLTGIWCVLGASLGSGPRLRNGLEKLGPKTLPVALIALGIYILISK